MKSPILGCVALAAASALGQDPGRATWSGAGADSNWSTVANWAEGRVPTTNDWAKFPSGSAEPWHVNLDADYAVADFQASGATTFFGGHALTAKVSGNLFKKYNVFNYGVLTATGTGTEVRVIADNPEGIATLGGGTSLVAADGALIAVDKLCFSDNGNMTLLATGACSRLSFTMWGDYFLSSDNVGISFKAADGGSVELSSGNVLTVGYGAKTKMIADGGTLDMPNAKTVSNCSDLSLTVAHGGSVRLASANLSGGNVALTADAAWTATNAPLVTTGALTLGGGVKYTVDVSAFSSLTGSVKLAVARAGGTLSFTAPTTDVARSGKGASTCLASLAKEGSVLYLTLSRAAGPARALIALDATATGGRTLPNPVSYVTCWGGLDSPTYPEFVDYAVFFTATGGDPERDQFVNPSNETTFVDYDFSRLIAKCQAALDRGIKPYLKLGNVPIKFTHGCDWTGADGGAYQFNIRPPDDDRYDAYYAYMRALATALADEFGRDEVRTWRFAVLTEANNPHWFQAKDKTSASTKTAFFKLYDYTAKAVTEVLGTDIAFGTHLLDPSNTTRTFTYSDVIAHCKNGANAATGGTGAPLSLLDFSYYHWTAGKDIVSAGRVDFVATVRRALTNNGFSDVIIAFDEGRVGQSNQAGSTTASGDAELITRAVGQSWQAAFDVRHAKSILDCGGETFSAWGWFAGPDTGCEGVPAVSYFTARELAKFAGMRQLAPTVTVNNLTSTKEVVEALAAVGAEGTNVLLAACHFRDKLTYSTEVAAQAVVTLPAAMRGKRARLAVLTLDDTNNWFTDWIADRAAYGIGPGDFWGGMDEQSPLSILVGDSYRQLFAETLMPRYALKAAALAPVETTLDVPADGVVTVPIDFVGNSAVFVSLALDEEPTTCVWTGAGADGNWLTVANWTDCMWAREIDYAKFPSGSAESWEVVLDTDCAAADFYVTGATTFSGGHALTARVSGHLSPSYFVFLRAPLTVTGMGTTVSVAPDNAENKIVLGGVAALTASDGATLSTEKLNFDDNGGFRFLADGAGSKLSFTMSAVKTLNWGNPNIMFKATEGGTLAFNSGNALTFASGSLATLWADGGTLDMTKSSVSCNDLTLTVAHGGRVKLSAVNLTGGNVNFMPDVSWTGTTARVTTTGAMTLGKGVQYTVDLSAWKGGSAKLAVAKATGTLTFTTPTGGVTLVGADTGAYAATLSKESKTVYLTLTANYPSWGGEMDAGNKAKYDVWASKYGFPTPSAVRQEAYLLNCDNTDEAVAAAKAAFRIPGIAIAPDGTVTVSEPVAPEGGFNGKVEIRGCATVDGTYDLPEDRAEARFYKAFLTLDLR